MDHMLEKIEKPCTCYLRISLMFINCLRQLCPTRPAGGMRPSLRFRCSTISLRIDVCPHFDNLKFDIFDAGGCQCLMQVVLSAS